MINSYIGLTVRELDKKRIESFNNSIDADEAGELAVASFFSEELYVYEMSTSTFLYLYRDDSTVDCTDIFDESRHTRLWPQRYYLELDFNPDPVAAEEIATMGLGNVLDRGVLEKLILDWYVETTNPVSKSMKRIALRTLLLYEAGQKYEATHGEYDTWFNFVKHIKLKDL